MPFLDLRSTESISPQQELTLKKALGKAIGCIPGKSEDSLMIQFSDRCRLWFGGKQGNFVFLNVMLYGSAEPQYYESFQEVVIPLLERELGAQKVYLKFEESDNWFWKF